MSFITFRQLLSRAWKVTVNNKFLWLLGVFAAASVNTGIYQGALSNISLILQTDNFLSGIRNLYSQGVVGQLVDIGNTQLPTLLSGGLFWSVVFVIGMIFAIYVTIISQIAIIKSTPKLAEDKKTTLTDSFREAQSEFLPVLVITIISRLIYILVFILTSFPIYLFLVSQNLTALVLSTLVFFFIFIPISLLISFVSTYAINFAIFEKTTLLESFMRGWKLFKNNTLLSIEIGILLLIIKTAALLVTIIVAGIIFIPIAAIIAALFALQQGMLFSILLVVVIFIGIFAYLLINGFFTALYLTAWTTLFRSLTANTLRSKLDRLLESAFAIFVKNPAKLLTEIAEESNLTSRAIYKAAKRKYNEMRPTLEEIIAEIENRYESSKPKMQEASREISRILEQEKENLAPTVERITREVRKEVKKSTTKVKAGVKALGKQVAKKYPEVKRFATAVQEKYQEELAKELRKVAGKKKKGAKK